MDQLSEADQESKDLTSSSISLLENLQEQPVEDQLYIDDNEESKVATLSILQDNPHAQLLLDQSSTADNDEAEESVLCSTTLQENPHSQLVLDQSSTDDNEDSAQAAVISTPPEKDISTPEEALCILVMKKQSMCGKIWKYFGYRLTQGILAPQDKPTCILCNTDIVLQDVTDNLENFMRQHLRTAHSEEYTKYEQLGGDTPTSDSAAMKDFQFPVWMFFDNSMTATCRLCKRICTVDQKGDKSPLTTHLALQHSKIYTSCHKMQMRGLQNGFLIKKSAKSPAWIWFGFRPNQYGRPQDKEIATCFVCEKECGSKGSSTTGLLRHLESYHLDEYRICEEIQNASCKRDGSQGAHSSNPSNEITYFDETLLPKKNGSSLVWKYYGYRPNPDEGMETVPLHKDIPTCRMCNKDIKSSGRSTSNLFQHLKHHHPQEYNICVGRVKSEPGDIIPNPTSKSHIWMFFGYRANKKDKSSRKLATCSVCKKDFPSRKKNTSHLIHHLRKSHPDEYLIYQQVRDQASNRNKSDSPSPEKIKTKERDGTKEEIVAKLLTKKRCTSVVWEYFGFWPNPTPGWEDEPLNKFEPTCRLCLMDLKSGRSTSNLFQHLKYHHAEEFKTCSERAKVQRLLASQESKDLAANIVPSNRGDSSPVWMFFGLQKPEDCDEELQDDDTPTTCLLCKKSYVARGGSNTCLFNHLETLHPEEYAICQKVIDKYRSRDNPKKNTPDSKGDSISTLLPISASTPVEKYFGYRPNNKPGLEVAPLHLGTPVCRLCWKDVNYKGLFQHICTEHRDRICITRVPPDKSKDSINISDADKDSENMDAGADPMSVPPSKDSTKSLYADSTATGSTPSSQISNYKLFTCRGCAKILVNGTVINDARAGVGTPDGEPDYDYCWDCYSALPGFSFTSKVKLESFTSKVKLESVQNTMIESDVTLDKNDDSICESKSKKSRKLAPTEKSEDDAMDVSFESIHDEIWGSSPTNSDQKSENKNCGSITETDDQKEDIFKPVDTDSNRQSSTTEIDDSDVTAVVLNQGYSDSKGQSSAAKTVNDGAKVDIAGSSSNEKSSGKIVVKGKGELMDGNKDYSNSTNRIGQLFDIADTLVVTDRHTLEETSGNIWGRRKQTDAYTCKKCDKVFQTDYTLRRHDRNVHKGDKLICCICSKKFNWPSSLKEHERLHFGDTPYKCKSCGKGFVSRPKLERHSMIHTGEKPHLCKICGKGFTQKSTLKAHERTHNGDKPYSCKFCDKKFVQRSNRAMHQKKHEEFGWEHE